MKIILISAFAATTMMTLFSYLVSNLFKKLYKEPRLLKILMSELNLKISVTSKSILAWIIHYFIGLSFVIGFHYAIMIVSPQSLWIAGIIFGIIIGTLGIFGWHLMFLLTGKHLSADLIGYYAQLFVAHLIFALTVTAIYNNRMG